MPMGVYPRTELHRAICSRGGKANAENVRGKRKQDRWEDRTCPTCGKIFTERIVVEKTYCCRGCSDNSPVIRKRRSEALRARIPPHTGHKHSEESKHKMSLAKLGKRISIATEFVKQGVSWKGNRNEYSELHYLVRKMWGSPNKCEHCGIENVRIDWASINHTYTMDREDWIPLCVRCHIRMDKRNKRKRDTQ